MDWDEKVGMIEEDDSIGVKLLLEGASLHVGIGGGDSELLVDIEEVDGKRCAWVEEDDVETSGVDIDKFVLGLDETWLK
ncbi:hypothetical protein TNCV_3135011 [Trichonephila clavipes]|nr:hypothetical protein TNCV_3135011 [Trichonephila clavipes]